MNLPAEKSRATGPGADRPGWEAFSNALIDRRLPILGALALLVLGASLGIPRIQLETHAEKFLASDHPARIRYDAFKQDFGLDTPIVLLLETNDVFDPDFLRELERLHTLLETEIPWVIEVRSLARARWLESEGDTLSVRTLADFLPADPAPTTRTASTVPGSRSDLAERIESNPAYRDDLVSRDRRITTVSLRLDAFPKRSLEFADPGTALTATQSREAVRAVRAVVDHWVPSGVAYHLAGNPTLNEQLAHSIQTDMKRFIVWAVLAMGVSLALLFRRISAVLMPLGLALLSIVAVLGVAGWLGQPLNVASQILPPLLIAVGVSASIHLLSAFYRDFDANGDRRRALGRAIAHAGPATLTTGLTTAAGLASFALASDMAPVHQLGVLAPIGVLITLAFTLIGLPAGLACLAVRRAPDRNEAPLANRLGVSLGRVGVWTLERPGRVLVGCGILASAALVGTLRIEANNDALAYFPQGHPIRTSTEILDRSLAGSINLELIVDTGRAGGLHDPELLAAFDALEKDVRKLARDDGPRLRKVFSLADLVRETHAALVGEAAGFEPLPSDARLVAQELLLFEAAGAEGLDRFAQDLDAKGRISLRGAWLPAKEYQAFVPDVVRLLNLRLPDGISVESTGLIVLFAEAVEATSRAFVESYGAALILISALMVAFLGSLRAGLLSMIPNLLPIAFTLGLMGWLSLDLDLFTLLIGSIALGLAVDDTIHLADAFRRFHRETGDLEAAIRKGLETTGAAILTSSIALCLGFSGFMFSSMTNLAHFGALTVICIGLALVIDVLVLPALSSWIFGTPREERSRLEDSLDHRKPSEGILQ